MATEKIWSENQTLCNKLDVAPQAGVGFLLNQAVVSTEKAATTLKI